MKMSNCRVETETMHCEYTTIYTHLHSHIVVTFRNGQKSVAEYLVSLPQVDVSAKDNGGDTALHYASR